MKETPIFEEVLQMTLKQPGLWRKLLLGGLLSFVPVLNIFAFGYLYRVSCAVRHSGRPVLPDWRLFEDWRGLFMDGLRFAVVWLGFWLLPVLLGVSGAWLMSQIGLGGLSNILIWSVFMLSIVFFSSALYRYNMRRDFKDLLNLSLILRMTWMELPCMLIPIFFFLGVFVWLLPFYGLTLFAGFTVMIVFTSLRYRALEARQSVSS